MIVDPITAARGRGRVRTIARAAALSVAFLLLSSAKTPSPPLLPTAFDAGWKGEKICEKLFENASVRVGRCTFPPGGGHDRHFHPPHWGYIVQGGTMRITDAGGTHDRVLQAGSNWWSDGVPWHEALNIGTTTAVYIIVEPKAAP